MGMLFSAWQATTQALQPMHAVWSIDHSPSVFRLVIFEDKSVGKIFRMAALGRDEVWVLLELLQRADLHKPATLHAVVILGDSERAAVARPR